MFCLMMLFFQATNSAVQATNGTDGGIANGITAVLNSAFVVFLLGTLVSVGTTAFFNWRQRNVEKDRLRRVLVREIQHFNKRRIQAFLIDSQPAPSHPEGWDTRRNWAERNQEKLQLSDTDIDEIIDDISDSDEPISAEAVRFPQHVYESNVEKLERLEYDQIDAVLSYYEYQAETEARFRELVKSENRPFTVSEIQDVVKEREGLRDELVDSLEEMLHWRSRSLELLESEEFNSGTH